MNLFDAIFTTSIYAGLLLFSLVVFSGKGKRDKKVKE
jgi:hypothetical protein